MTVRKPGHDALRDAQLRLKALVCETVSLRESLQRESQRKSVALGSAKQQEQAAKSADRSLREAEFTARHGPVSWHAFQPSVCWPWLVFDPPASCVQEAATRAERKRGCTQPHDQKVQARDARDAQQPRGDSESGES